VYALLQPFLRIALLRGKPQDLPWSPLLMWLVLAVHLAMGTAAFALRLDGLSALAAGVASTALLVAMTASLLYANRKPARVIQAVTALAGADVVVGLAALPVSAALHADLGPEAASGLPGLLFLVLLGWNLAVAGHVLRHALDAPLPLGIVIALVFYVLSVNVLHTLFPGMG